MNKLIQAVNSNVHSIMDAMEHIYKDKIFVAWDGNRIDNYFKTKRGAEGYVSKQQKHSYYDESIMEMRTLGAGLEVGFINANDLIDIKTNKEIWYKEIRNKMGYPHMAKNVVYVAKDAQVSEEVMTFITDLVDDLIESGSLKHVEFEQEETKIKVEIQEETKLDEAIEVTEQESEQQKIGSITENVKVILNPEMNGIELHFEGKPNEQIRSALKQSGFRWSKRGFWYAKQSLTSFNLAESLTGQKIDKEQPNAVYAEIVQIDTEKAIADIDINDLEKYQVSDDLQRDLRSISMFDYDYQKECKDTFSQINEQVKELLEKVGSNTMLEYEILVYFQSFKKRYYDQYMKYLHMKARTPSWMITGRGNLNVSRYNKKQDQLHNCLGKLVEMDEKHKNKVLSFERKLK